MLAQVSSRSSANDTSGIVSCRELSTHGHVIERRTEVAEDDLDLAGDRDAEHRVPGPGVVQVGVVGPPCASAAPRDDQAVLDGPHADPSADLYGHAVDAVAQVPSNSSAFHSLVRRGCLALLGLGAPRPSREGRIHG